MSKQTISLTGLILLTCFAAGSASAEFKMPNCNALINWAAAGNIADKLATGNYRVYQSGARLFSGLMDRNFVPVFGTPFSQVTDAQLTALSGLSGNCRLQLRAAFQKQRSAPLQNLLSNSESYLYAVFFAGAKQNTNLLRVMALQKKAYVEYGKAVEVRTAQEAELATLKPSLESIERIRAMKGEKQLTFLSSEITPHQQNLDRHLLGMIDGVIVRTATAMREAPATLEGLRKISALNVDIRQKMGKMRSTSWGVLNTAYAETVNKAAAAAIDEFKAELAAVPPTDDGMATVRKSPVTLFPYKPVPANYAAYQAAARDRLSAMGVERKALACRETLAERKLTDIADTKMLGQEGETSLGAFICGMADGAGYKFVEYEKPGMFGSTHTLTLEWRGVSTVVEMEMVEPTKGHEMLAGTHLKDAAADQDMTLVEWQALAAWITGKGPPPPHLRR